MPNDREWIIEMLSITKQQARPSKLKDKSTILEDIKYDSLMYVLDTAMNQITQDGRRLDTCKLALNAETVK